jgi:hypothetical protein
VNTETYFKSCVTIISSKESTFGNNYFNSYIFLIGYPLIAANAALCVLCAALCILRVTKIIGTQSAQRTTKGTKFFLDDRVSQACSYSFL